MSEQGVLTFFCGKMGAGKSTRAQRLARETAGVMLSEDGWVAAICHDDIPPHLSQEQYAIHYLPLLKRHILALLQSGIAIALDFSSNTIQQRAWLKELIAEHNLQHQLIYLDIEDQLCLERLRARREAHPERAAYDADEVFYIVKSNFEAPVESEGFNVVIVHD